MFSSRRLPRVCLKSFAKRTRVWTRPRRPGTTHGLPRAPGPRLAGLQGGQPGVQGSEGRALPGPAWRLPRECTPLQSPCDGAEVWPLHAGRGRAGTLDGVSASSRAAARRRAPRGTDRRLPQGPAAAGAARPELVRPRPDRSVCGSRGGKCGGERPSAPRASGNAAGTGHSRRGLSTRWTLAEQRVRGTAFAERGWSRKAPGPRQVPPLPRGDPPGFLPSLCLFLPPPPESTEGCEAGEGQGGTVPCSSLPIQIRTRRSSGTGPTGAALPRAAGTGAANPAARATPGLAAGV